MRFVPYFGLNSDRRESSMMRSKTSRISNGFRISGFTRESRSSTGNRGEAAGSISGIFRGVRMCSEATHSRDFRIASNLKKNIVLVYQVHSLQPCERNIVLIGSHLVSETGYHSMNLGTAQFLGADSFPRCHFHQRRASEIGLSLILDENGIIGQGWVICAPRGRRSKDNCARRLSVLCTNG